MIRYIAPSGLTSSLAILTQGSASLHPGLRVQRPFGTKRTQPRSGGVLAAQGGVRVSGRNPGLSRPNRFSKPRKGEVNYIPIVVSVKGGENVSVAMVRDFAHVIEREQAAMGFFVTLAEPSMTDHAPGPMSKESVAFGFYDEPRFGAEYPKLQILTIEGLMAGTERPRYPDLSLGRSTFKRAAVEDMAAEQGELL